MSNNWHFSPCDGCEGRCWLADVAPETAVSFGSTASMTATHLLNTREYPPEYREKQTQYASKLNQLPEDDEVQGLVRSCISTRLAGYCNAKPETSQNVPVNSQYL